MLNKLISQSTKSKGLFITFEGGEGVGKTTQINLLKSYDWSGNIRGLRNVVERLIILGDETKISENNVIEYSNK